MTRVSDAGNLIQDKDVQLDHVDKDGRHVYHVESNGTTYPVAVDQDGTTFCKCKHQQYSGDDTDHCKHELAAIAVTVIASRD